MGRTLLLIAAIGLITSASLAEPQKAKKDTSSTEPNNPKASAAQQTPNRPISVRLLNTGKSQSDSTDERRHVQLEEWYWWASVVAGAAVAFIAFLQWLAFVGQSKLAQEALGQSREALKITLRAYVSVDSVVSSGVTVGSRPGCHIVIKNNGQTPAHDVVCYSSVNVLEVPLVEVPTQEPPAGIPVSRGTLGSKAPSRFDSQRSTALDESEVEALRVGVAALYCIGGVRYRDVFGDEHTTRFCVMEIAGDFVRYAEGNQDD